MKPIMLVEGGIYSLDQAVSRPSDVAKRCPTSTDNNRCRSAVPAGQQPNRWMINSLATIHSSSSFVPSKITQNFAD